MIKFRNVGAAAHGLPPTWTGPHCRPPVRESRRALVGVKWQSRT
jgi:hypothetical protein